MQDPPKDGMGPTCRNPSSISISEVWASPFLVQPSAGCPTWCVGIIFLNILLEKKEMRNKQGIANVLEAVQQKLQFPRRKVLVICTREQQQNLTARVYCGKLWLPFPKRNYPRKKNFHNQNHPKVMAMDPGRQWSEYLEGHREQPAGNYGLLSQGHGVLHSTTH